MPGVYSFDALDKFTCRIYKYHEDRPDLPWVNNYEVFAIEGGVLNAIQALLTSLVLFEQVLHAGYVKIYKAVASTYEAETPTPYNPDSFCSMAFDLSGSRSSPAPLDLRVCWHVSKNAATGRQGQLLYRGVLQERDVKPDLR